MPITHILPVLLGQFEPIVPLTSGPLLVLEEHERGHDDRTNGTKPHETESGSIARGVALLGLALEEDVGADDASNVANGDLS